MGAQTQQAGHCLNSCEIKTYCSENYRTKGGKKRGKTAETVRERKEETRREGRRGNEIRKEPRQLKREGETILGLKTNKQVQNKEINSQISLRSCV